MKKFLSNNWKRIIYIVAAGFIIYNIIMTILTKNTIIDDFYIYGQDYKKPSISINVNTDGIAGDEESIAKTISDNTGMSDELAQGVLLLAGGILVILIISSLFEGDPAPAKKK